MGPLEPNWTQLGPYLCPIWAQMAPDGPNWAHLVPNGLEMNPIGSKWAQIGPTWVHWVPFFDKFGPKFGLYGPMGRRSCDPHFREPQQMRHYHIDNTF